MKDFSASAFWGFTLAVAINNSSFTAICCLVFGDLVMASDKMWNTHALLRTAFLMLI